MNSLWQDEIVDIKCATRLSLLDLQDKGQHIEIENESGCYDEQYRKQLAKAIEETLDYSNSRSPAQQNQIDNDKLTDQPDDVVPPVAAEEALGQSSSRQSHGTNIGNVAEGSIGDDSVHSTVEVTIDMEDVYHKKSQSFYWHVDPLDTHVLDPLGPHEKYSPCVPLEIYFEFSRNYNYFDRDLSEDGTLTLVHQSEVQLRSYRSKIVDACWLETRNKYVDFLWCCPFLKPTRTCSDIVETIIDAGIRIRNLDPKNGPKVLRLRVGVKIYHNQIRCEDCSKQRELERDALIKKMLKRVRVVADANDVNDEERGRGRQRHPVVLESEVCPICLEEFVVGPEDVTSMPCTHVVHEYCIWRWFKRSQLNCPICHFEMFIELGHKATETLGFKLV